MGHQWRGSCVIALDALANGSHLRRSVETLIPAEDAGFVAAMATRWARRAHDAASNVVETDPEMAALIYDAAFKRCKSIVRREVGADNDAAGVEAALRLCSSVYSSWVIYSGGQW